MTDEELIRRGEVQRAVNLALCKAPLKTTLGLIDALNDTRDAIAALPAVTVGVRETVIHRAVLDWIRDDTGAAIKMAITPDQANALTARFLAALEPVAAPDPAAIREGEILEHIEHAKRLRRYDWQEWTAQDIEDAEGIICAFLALIQKKGTSDDRA